VSQLSNKQFLLDSIHDEFGYTAWLLEKDQIYAAAYFNLLHDIEQLDTISDDELEDFIEQLGLLADTYDERFRAASDWVTPKKAASNELVHNDNGDLTPESLALLRTAILNKNSEKVLVSDTGKTIYFDNKWYSMIQPCGFRDIAVEKLTDFLSKFVEENGWAKYFVGNIGKNDNSQIQDYHPLDIYNIKHGTSYAAMHLGNTRRCVIVSVDTGTPDGRGEPRSITFLEIGAHTIIDRLDENSFKYRTGRPITDATTEELATLLDI
jgi:hypothetical protein